MYPNRYVKIFSHGDYARVEEEINDFLNSTGRDVKDIKFSTSTESDDEGNCYTVYNAMVIMI